MNANAEHLQNNARRLARLFTLSLHRVMQRGHREPLALGETPWDDLPAEEKRMLEEAFVDMQKHVHDSRPQFFIGGMGQD